jgi:hypothetical protein
MCSETDLEVKDMEMDRQLARGKCRRKLSPEHALFAEGNALRSSKYYQSMGLSGVDGMEEEEEDKPVVFVCRLFNCHGVGFHSLRAYEEHYDLYVHDRSRGLDSAGRVL